MMNDESVLTTYLKEINKIPLLSREDENELAIRAYNGDKEAKQRLIKSNLRFVVTVAKKYRNLGMELGDLVSEGNIGLMTAVERFNPEKGFHFISYAVWWIRQAIIKALSDKSRAIRLPANKVSDMLRIEQTAHKIGQTDSEDQKISKIAHSLGMEKKYVYEMLSIGDDIYSLDAPISENNTNVLGDFVEENRYAAPEDNAIEECMKDDLTNTLSTLQGREASVLKLRYGLEGGKPLSLEEIGKRYNLSKERIRQIEMFAMNRMRHPFRATRLSSYVA